MNIQAKLVANDRWTKRFMSYMNNGDSGQCAQIRSHYCEFTLLDIRIHASARTVCAVQLVSMADSRTKRLCVLLIVSNSRHCIAHMWLIQPLLMSRGNKHRPRIVAVQKRAANHCYHFIG